MAVVMGTAEAVAVAEEWRSFWLARLVRLVRLVRPEVPQQPPDHAGRHNEDNRAARRPAMECCGHHHTTNKSARVDDVAHCIPRNPRAGESNPSEQPGRHIHHNLSRDRAR